MNFVDPLLPLPHFFPVHVEAPVQSTRLVNDLQPLDTRGCGAWCRWRGLVASPVQVECPVVSLNSLPGLWLYL